MRSAGVPESSVASSPHDSTGSRVPSFPGGWTGAAPCAAISFAGWPRGQRCCSSSAPCLRHRPRGSGRPCAPQQPGHRSPDGQGDGEAPRPRRSHPPAVRALARERGPGKPRPFLSARPRHRRAALGAHSQYARAVGHGAGPRRRPRRSAGHDLGRAPVFVARLRCDGHRVLRGVRAGLLAGHPAHHRVLGRPSAGCPRRGCSRWGCRSRCATASCT